jgi:hypothetical protein
MFPTSITLRLAELGNTRVRMGRGRNARQQRREETEGSGGGAFIGHNFMQRAARQAALRQVTVDGGKAEGDRSCRAKPLHFGQ